MEIGQIFLISPPPHRRQTQNNNRAAEQSAATLLKSIRGLPQCLMIKSGSFSIVNPIRLYLKPSGCCSLPTSAQSNRIAKSVSVSDCLIPFRVQQSFRLTWPTIMVHYLNHFRTWNLAHLDITYNTVPSRHFEVLEVHWSDYGPSPEACSL